MRAIGDEFADAVCESLPGWFVALVTDRLVAAFGAAEDAALEEARLAGSAAADLLSPALHELLTADVDEQASTPLSLVRSVVPAAGAVLARADVPPPRRDRFRAERFPDDVYDLAPASLASLGEHVGELAIAWGAAKAFEHRARHGGTGSG